MFWGLAGALDGHVLLRLEDHDRQRSRPEYEGALLDDLDWLGFVPDVFVTATFRAGPCEGRQSDREEAYRAALAPLVRRGLVYGCDCSRRAIEASGDPSAPEIRYPGTCRDRHLPLSHDVSWRLRLDPGVERFDDVLVGVVEQDPAAQCGDLLLRDRLGNWTYQWAATADDWLQGITLVVRGEDLLASTGRQIRLARLLGRLKPPVFVHHPLVMKSPSQKLSKSDRDTGIRDLGAAGWLPEQVIGHAAALGGLQASAEPLLARDVSRLFDRATR